MLKYKAPLCKMIRQALAVFGLIISVSAFGKSNDIPQPPTYTVEDLKYDLTVRAKGRIADLIPLLPEVFKKHYVAVFESESVQEGSFEYPRIISFNHDASLVLTFNGHPSQKGYEVLEILSFDYDSRKFTLEAIIAESDYEERKLFLSVNGGEPLVDRDLIAGPNPKVCLTCHRANPRPNWSPFNGWPGVFGQKVPGIFEPSLEFDAYKNLINRWENIPRYKNLEKKEELDSTIPGERLYGVVLPAVFTDLLTHLNMLRLAKIIVEHPEFNKYKWDIMATEATPYCHPHFMRDFDETAWKASIERANKAQHQFKTSQNRKILQTAGPRSYKESLFIDSSAGSMAYVLGKMGIGLDDYSMTLERKTYSFTSGKHSFKYVYKLIAKDWKAKTGEDIDNGYVFDDEPSQRQACEVIHQKASAPPPKPFWKFW